MRPVSIFHRWLAEQLPQFTTIRPSRWSIIAPRSGAKSTWVSWAYPLFCGLHRYEQYIQLISDTHGQACQHLDGIKHELETNQALQDAYPTATGRGDVWREDRIRLPNGVVIEALGTGNKVRGRRERAERPSLIILDDPENDEQVASAVQRAKTWTWFTRAVMNAGSPRTNVLVLGTTLHRDCLVMRLANTGGWKSRLFKSIVTWPERMDLWAEFELIYNDFENSSREENARTFYEKNKDEMNK